MARQLENLVKPRPIHDVIAPMGIVVNQEVTGSGGTPVQWSVAILLAGVGALLFILAYPPWNLGLVTGWIILVPLFVAVCDAPFSRAALFGGLFGLLSNIGVFSWLCSVPGIRWYHIALLDVYLALYPALWSVVAARFIRGSFVAQMGVVCVWVLLEYARGHAGFLALPWMTLAQTQVDNTSLLQTAGLFGESAVTFLVVIGNVAIWNLIGRGSMRAAAVCALTVLVAQSMGAFALNGTNAGRQLTINVAALRTDFPAPPPLRVDPEVRLIAQVDVLQHALPIGVELVVLPESAVVNPKLFPTQIDALKRVAVENRVAVVAGVAEATKFDDLPVRSGDSGLQLRSGAWLITRGKEDPQRYVKSRLVPFAESTPLKNWLVWPDWLIPQKPEVEQGPPPQSYVLSESVRVGIMMCWEALFVDHARALVDDRATVLLMLANEGWFGKTAAGAQHNLTARMRAAETHRSVVVASNMGPSLMIDPQGRLLAESSTGGMHWVSAQVPLATEQSIYSRMGDKFVVGCGIVILACATFLWVQRRVAPTDSPATDAQQEGQPIDKVGLTRWRIIMRHIPGGWLILIVLVSLTMPNVPAYATPPQIEPCSLLTTAEVEQVVGKLKGTPKADKEGAASWCNYEFANGKDAMEVWVFPADAIDRAKKKSKKPVPVKGLGDEALMDRGAFGLDYLDLYIKKGDTTVKLSIKKTSGDEDKLKALGQTAVGRLR